MSLKINLDCGLEAVFVQLPLFLPDVKTGTPESLLKMKSSFYPCKYIEAHARVSPQVVVVRICAGGGLSPALLAWEAGLLQPFFLFCFVLFCFFLQPF